MHAIITPPNLNRIVTENQLAGNPSTEWDINGWGDPTIQGFGHEMSINVGERIDFKIKTDSVDYRVDIYRMGYYGGMGARKVDTIIPSAAPLPQSQPNGFKDPITKLYDCSNWAISASWSCPADAVSGIYFARLVRHDPSPTAWHKGTTGNVVDDSAKAKAPAAASTNSHAYGARGIGGKPANALLEPFASHIYFIVRDDACRSDIVFQTADTTWQAYNRYGGHSTYAEFDSVNHPRGHGPPIRAHKVSYNRPMETRHYRSVNKVFNGEYPVVRWLERNGYDVSYISGVDTARHGQLLLNHKLFLSVGHDEYWSGDQRKHVEAARAAGVHLAFFSGNEVFWKIRWEPSVPDGSDYRTMVVYKETQDNAKIDPLPNVWTGTWRDGREMNPEGPQPENALTGTIFTVNAWRNDPLIVPAEYSKLRLWRNTKVSNLEPGERAILLKGLLGHEWDEDIDNGFRPPGLFRLSETTVDNVFYLQDEGGIFDTGTATHHLTMYRHESGALVFGAGTIQWGWGLDAHHDTDTGIPPERANPSATRVGVDPHGPDKVVQQATVNLFADMGIQPATLQTDLVAAEASNDSEPPVSCITFPTDGISLQKGTAIVIRGTAEDFGGGVVAGVEVSTDGGARWHPATGRESWEYEWCPRLVGMSSILCRAVDDSGNLETSTARISVDILDK